MKALLALILMSGVYAKSLRLMPSRPDMMLSNDLTDSTFDETSLLAATPRHPPQVLDDEDYKNNILHHKFYAKLQRYYLNKLQNQQAITNLEDSEIQRTAYLLIKTMKQRDKRYTSSYLTLCHFKICNMGRKRTTRYFHMIKSLHDDHT